MDSNSFQHFARVDPLRIPGKSALQADIGAIRAATFKALNGALLAAAKAEQVESGKELRMDATVTESHITEPSDSRLRFDAVRVMIRLLYKAQQRLGPSIVFRNRQRLAKRRHRGISTVHTALERAKLYKDLLVAVH